MTFIQNLQPSGLDSDQRCSDRTAFRVDSDQRFLLHTNLNSGMGKLGITRDLSILTLAKLIILGIIYIVLFAPFANRPDDTVTHILGTAP